MRSLAILLLVGILLSLCAQGISPEEIRQKAIESSKNIETCKFKMMMSTELCFGNNSNPKPFTSSSVNGAYDFINRKMFMKMTTTMRSLKGSFQMTSESYLINDTMYIKMIYPNGTYRWVKTEMRNDLWNRSNQIKQQVDLLKISEVKRLPDETINGTDCYVLELKPDLDKFIELMVSSKQENIQNISLLKDMLRDVRVKEWITKDKFYPIKTQIVTVMEMPMIIGKIKQVTNMTIELYDINKPINIELPPEAESATLLLQPS